MQSSQEKEQGEKVFATPRTEPLKPVRVVHFIESKHTIYFNLLCCLFYYITTSNSIYRNSGISSWILSKLGEQKATPRCDCISPRPTPLAPHQIALSPNGFLWVNFEIYNQMNRSEKLFGLSAIWWGADGGSVTLAWGRGSVTLIWGGGLWRGGESHMWCGSLLSKLAQNLSIGVRFHALVS